METLQTVLLVVQVLVAVALVGFILVQHGKGADAGAAFGSGASATVFGARGSGNFLTRTTSVLAFIFLANSMVLAFIAKERIENAQSLMDAGATTIEQPLVPVDTEQPQAPALPVSDVPVLPSE